MARRVQSPLDAELSHGEPELFPSVVLREKLESVGIGRMYHAHGSLMAMIERRTGHRVHGECTPDQLAEALIKLEERIPQYLLN